MLVEGRTAGKLSQRLKSSKHAPEVTKGNEGGGCCCLVAWGRTKSQGAPPAPPQPGEGGENVRPQHRAL